VRGWRIIVVACALLWGSVDAFALRCVTSGNRCTGDFHTGVSRARYYKPDTGRFWTRDTDEGNNEDPLSLHKYLYCQANPVNGSDPTGHDFDMVSMMSATGIGESLESMYNAGVSTVLLAMQHTIIGVQNHQTEAAIYGGYFKDVAIGLGIGVAVGVAADIAGDLIYGGSVEGEIVEIEVNGANTVEGSRGFAAVASPTEDLVGAAARAGRTMGPGKGPVYGTKFHVEFEKEVNALGYENTEVAYKNGVEVTPGTPGSVEVDVAIGNRASPQAIYDLKTGSAKLTPARVAQLRQHVPNGQNIPIIEIKPSGRVTTH